MSLRRAAAATALSTALSTALAAGAIAPLGAATAADPAAGSDRAATAGCVSKAEFRKLKNGMTIAQVKRLTGTNGRQVTKTALPEGKFVVGRAYKACAPREGVGLAFSNEKGPTYRLASKSASWQGR